MNNNRKYSLQDEKNRLIYTSSVLVRGVRMIPVLTRGVRCIQYRIPVLTRGVRYISVLTREVRIRNSANRRFVWNNYPSYPGREVKKIA